MQKIFNIKLFSSQENNPKISECKYKFGKDYFLIFIYYY